MAVFEALNLVFFMFGLLLYSVSLRFWDNPKITGTKRTIAIPRVLLGSMLLFGIGFIQLYFTMPGRGAVIGCILMLAGTSLCGGWLMFSKDDLRLSLDGWPPPKAR